jgi:DNA-binding transcriptional regulator of glucitol operon
VTPIVVLWAGAVAALMVAGVLGWWLWDRRYRGDAGGSFTQTGEVFRDPSTGRWVRVWEDPATGKRQYREEDDHG